MKTFKKLILLIHFFVFIGFSQMTLSTNAKVSIITCGTASATHAMYGHTGIRITDYTQDIDLVYNYGAFDFSTPNFALKFIKGDLQYFVTCNNFSDFEYNYRLEERTIYENELKLNQVQKQELFNVLNQSLTSDDKFYTYKFIDRNCTTMVVDKINSIIGNEVLKQTSTNLSYRGILFPYMSDFYQKLGIQIMFGAKVDQPATRLFLPFELKKSLENNPTISYPTKIIFQSKINNTNKSLLNSIYPLILILTLIIFSKNSKIQNGYIFLTGILGVFLSLVGFYSLHEEVLKNYNILLFNPLLLIYIWFLTKKRRKYVITIGQLYLASILLYILISLNKVHLTTLLPIIITNFYLVAKNVIYFKKQNPNIIDL